MQDKQNLFIYGSLRDPLIFKSVCGLGFTLKPSHSDPHVLFGELALLPKHRRISPDNVYYYAVADEYSKIEGLVIYDVPAEAMREIDNYEGKFYQRETVTVNTANGQVDAQAYLASKRYMKKKFGDRFHVNLIHELWLRKRIDKFFQTHIRPGEKTPDADNERRAKRELLGTTERDLIISHLGTSAFSDYFLEHELDRPIPSIKTLFTDPEARPFVENYLTMVIKHVLFNQFEHKTQLKYRYEIDHLMHSHRYYNRTLSVLVALKMVNNNYYLVEEILKRGLETMPPEKQYDLLDYVKFAVSAADSAFDSRVARSIIDWIRNNRQPGLMPMGIELEFSNIGFMAVGSKNDSDTVFDGFKYFKDFCLDILSWKMGGYIDDHTGSDWVGRRRGFLELAPGRLNIQGELSKPATPDPWIINQLIMEITEFYPIKPHSLHITFQMRKGQHRKQKIMPLGFIKCLLALGGGSQETSKGDLWISRMGHDEIKQYAAGEEFVFARSSKRKVYLGGEDLDDQSHKFNTAYTMQYKFIRLEPRANYEPLIMALKGLQIAYNPADYLTAGQLNRDKKLQYHYKMLKKWSENPTPISRQTRSRFLKTINEGLREEGHRRPVHKLHYIDWALSSIDVQLRMFNRKLEEARTEKQGDHPMRVLLKKITGVPGAS